MRFILLFLASWAHLSLFSQETSHQSLFDKLYSFDTVRLTITFPFDSLSRTSNNEIDARISIESENGYLVNDQPLTLNLRGKFRRMKCQFPPLQLDFRKSMLKDLGLAPIEEMKLVTHCIDGEEGQQNLMEERLLYQVYESITKASYRTIWVNVQYCDLGHPGFCDTSGGFLLEPDPVIAARLNVKEKKIYNPREDSLQFLSYSNTAAFNFLIGNRDWSVVGARNAKLFYDQSAGQYIVIPYDFDFSNIVAASYRRETLGPNMLHPFDRIYQGEYFKDKAGLILKSFYVYQDTVLNAVKTAMNPLGQERRRQISKYFDKWFSMVRKNRPNDLMYDCVCPYNGGL